MNARVISDTCAKKKWGKGNNKSILISWGIKLKAVVTKHEVKADVYKVHNINYRRMKANWNISFIINAYE